MGGHHTRAADSCPCTCTCRQHTDRPAVELAPAHLNSRLMRPSYLALAASSSLMWPNWSPSMPLRQGASPRWPCCSRPRPASRPGRRHRRPPPPPGGAGARAGAGLGCGSHWACRIQGRRPQQACLATPGQAAPAHAVVGGGANDGQRSAALHLSFAATGQPDAAGAPARFQRGRGSPAGDRPCSKAPWAPVQPSASGGRTRGGAAGRLWPAQPGASGWRRCGVRLWRVGRCDWALRAPVSPEPANTAHHWCLPASPARAHQPRQRAPHTHTHTLQGWGASQAVLSTWPPSAGSSLG